MFEWQRHSQESTDVPPYKDLLAFINLRAQASESSSDFVKKTPRSEPYTRKYTNPPRHVAASLNNDCVVCKEKHPLYLCTKFKSMTHDEKRVILNSNCLCMNCMRSGHFVKNCKSLHKCHVCQKPHHTPYFMWRKLILLQSHLILLWRFEQTPFSWHATSRWSPQRGLLSLLELSSIVPRLHRSSLNDWQELWTYLVLGKKHTFLELLVSPQRHPFSLLQVSVSSLQAPQERPLMWLL